MHTFIKQMESNLQRTLRFESLELELLDLESNFLTTRKWNLEPIECEISLK